MKAILGGSFNPPGKHHIELINWLLTQFEEVVVIPCGTRPDKPVLEDTGSHRATLCKLAFTMPRVTVVYDDMEGVFTNTSEMIKKYEGIHFIEEGLDISTWENPDFLKDCEKSGIIRRHKFKDQLIRDKILTHQSYKDLVTDNVYNYIERYGLFKGRIPSNTTIWSSELKPFFVLDPYRPETVEFAKQFTNHSIEEANVIMVFGGDGTMLHAIRSYWQHRKPFLGVNMGTKGFLLNDKSYFNEINNQYVSYHLPMIHARTNNKNYYAFNDVWVQRGGQQTAWIEVSLNGKIVIERLMGDGILAASPSGSTGYASAMGAPPIQAGEDSWIVVGNNVMEPRWKSALLSGKSVMKWRNVGGEKRSLVAVYDGVEIGEVDEIEVSLSKYASVELLFHPSRSLTEKITQVQFNLNA